ncbi:7-cyano-7-deazaguanine synthase [Amycolatopsis sp. NPDC051758]|uniref:7-cyano-7-deazaguanine synthase n=1 Tax=Amycolatopsis sp. NPDC051758 TaxID=3363935 RepID=UPI0037BD7C29
MIRVDSSHDEISVRASISYRGGRIGETALTFRSLTPALDADEAHLIAGAYAIIAGQALLAPRISMGFPISAAAARPIIALAGMLYGAHAYVQRRSWRDPEIDFPVLRQRAQTSHTLNRRRAVLLWSGGKDALAALKVLRQNGFEVHGLHANASFSCAEHEREAAVALADSFDLPLLDIELDWDLIRALGKENSNSFDRYPLDNAVPHGRDLVLLVAAAIIARRIEAAYVCAGYEFDLWNKTVTWQRREVVRHDIQSRLACTQVDRLMRLALGVGFFSPIAPLREFAILKNLLTTERACWRHMQSCFWGAWCGECTKCLRYELAQQAIGIPAITFRKNPLCSPALALENLVSSIEDRSIPYWEQQVFCIFELHARGFFGHREKTCSRLGELRPWYGGLRASLRASLTSVTPDPMAPPRFHWDL